MQRREWENKNLKVGGIWNIHDDNMKKKMVVCFCFFVGWCGAVDDRQTDSLSSGCNNNIQSKAAMQVTCRPTVSPK